MILMRLDDRDKFIKLANARVNKTIKDFELIGNLANKSNYDYTNEDVVQIFQALTQALQQCQQRFLDSTPRGPASGLEFNLTNELAIENFNAIGDRMVADMQPGKAQKAYTLAFQLQSLSDDELLDLAEKLGARARELRSKDNVDAERATLRAFAALSSVSDVRKKECDKTDLRSSVDLSWLYLDTGRFAESIKMLRKSLNFDLEKNHVLDRGWLLLQTGCVYHSADKHKESADAFQETSEEFKKVGNEFWQGVSLAKLSEQYLFLDKVELAKETADAAFSLISKNASKTGTEYYCWQSAYYLPGAIYCCARPYLKDEREKARLVYSKGAEILDKLSYPNRWYFAQYIELLKTMPKRKDELKAIKERLASLK